MSPNSSLCPPNIVASFEAYIDDGIPPGGFVQACLENNLMEAFARADETNREALPHIVAWLYLNMPSNFWKSPKAVRDHLDRMAEVRADRQIVYSRGELPERDSRDEHDRTL